MIKLNIHEAKTYLSSYLDRLEAGETIILCKRNVPIAEIRALPSARRKPRILGSAKDKMHIPDSFFEPITREELALWEGSEGRLN